MTVLPIPAVRVAPDATKTTPPQGDSPALQSAPDITLAEVVEDLAHNLQLCRMHSCSEVLTPYVSRSRTPPDAPDFAYFPATSPVRIA
jgi:hypothetical protein